MIVVGSARSAGSTTLALVLAAHLNAVLVEADPHGGVLALRHRLGREPGLATLAAARPPLDIADHAQRLPIGLAAVVAPESPQRVSQLLSMAGDRLASLLAWAGAGGGAGSEQARRVVVDAGRLGPTSPALRLAQAASAVLVVARPVSAHLLAATELVGAMGANAHLVLVGTGLYRANDIADHLGCPVLGVIADDARTALALAEGADGAKLSRSALGRSVATLAATLAATAAEAATATEARSRRRLSKATP